MTKVMVRVSIRCKKGPSNFFPCTYTTSAGETSIGALAGEEDVGIEVEGGQMIFLVNQ